MTIPHCWLKRRRKQSGSVIADLGPALWLLIIGLVIPLMGLMTIAYRVICVYYGVGDACYQAAKQTTWTLAAAKAQSVLTHDCSIPGVSLPANQPSTNVVRRDINTQAEKEYQGKSTDPIQTQQFIYLIRLRAKVTITTILPQVSGNVPGLTGPFDVGFTQQVIDENPDGLVN